jgi:hypothetical protein
LASNANGVSDWHRRSANIYIVHHHTHINRVITWSSYDSRMRGAKYRGLCKDPLPNRRRYLDLSRSCRRLEP